MQPTSWPGGYSIERSEWKSNIDEEVREAVDEINSSKAPGLNGFPVKCVKQSGMEVLEWLERL